MRGRLIFPFTVVLAQLDTAATEAAGGGAGYDHVFREPVQIANATQKGADARVETELRIRAQIEPEVFEALQQKASGDDRRGDVALVTHFQELEAAGLIDGSGNATIRMNDRLAAIRESNPAQTLVMTIPATPGLYLHEITPIGFGLGNKRNLLYMRFRARAQAVVR